MKFSPPRRTGLAIGIGAIIVLLAADALFLLLIFQTPLSVITVLWIALVIGSLPTVGFIAYRSYGLAGAQYEIDANAFVIHWGGLREVVPMAAIDRIEYGRDIEDHLNPRGLWWPGCLVGRGEDEVFGQLAFFASTAQDQQLFVITGDGAYVISPEAADAFETTFAEVRQQGITAQVEYETVFSPFQQWPLWQDRLAQSLIAIPLLIALALFGFVALIYSSLPAQVPLHFDMTGSPDRVGPPSGLFILPVIALLIWAVNATFGTGLHVRAGTRLPAYIAWSSTIFVQLLLWAGAFFLINSAA